MNCSYNVGMRRLISTLVIGVAAVLLGGCANPYMRGFTGHAGLAMPDDAPIAVIGANRADPLQMANFDQALADAQASQRLMGSSTIVSAAPLRDAVAAEAGRELGASLVLYSFAYLNSTVERDTREYHRYSKANDEHIHERHSSDSTRHWYEYRAYFFAAGPVGDDTGSLANPAP